MHLRKPWLGLALPPALTVPSPELLRPWASTQGSALAPFFSLSFYSIWFFPYLVLGLRIKKVSLDAGGGVAEGYRTLVFRLLALG